MSELLESAELKKALINMYYFRKYPHSGEYDYAEAAGRNGTKLVNLGLAENLGIVQFDRNLRATRFTLTDAGIALAESFQEV